MQNYFNSSCNLLSGNIRIRDYPFCNGEIKEVGSFLLYENSESNERKGGYGLVLNLFKNKTPDKCQFTEVYLIKINKGQVYVSDSLSSSDFFSAKIFSENTFTDACSAAFCSAFLME